MTDIIEKITRAFELYDELADFIPEEALSQKLPGLPSNELGQRLWCVIGARESYLKALKAGQWQGFSCSLEWDKTRSITEVKRILHATAEETLAFIRSDEKYSSAILLDLLEHEAQHHGQIIRYLYGLKLGIPDSWKQQYSLQ